MACGYSPAEAQEPCRRICRVTTCCSGSSIVRRDVADEGDGAAFANAVDRRLVDGLVAPTASKTTSAPRPPVRARISAAGSPAVEEGLGGAERRERACRRASSISATIDGAKPAARPPAGSVVRSCPHPTTTAVSPAVRWRLAEPRERRRRQLRCMRGIGKREGVRQAIDECGRGRQRIRRRRRARR